MVLSLPPTALRVESDPSSPARRKEHVGGFTIVRGPDLDAALEWGRKLARVLTPLSIEVRPFAED